MRVWCRKWDNRFTREAVTVLIGIALYNLLCVLQLIGPSMNDNELRFEVFTTVKMLIMVFTITGCPRHIFRHRVLLRTRPLLGPLD
jgi:hypothetical protein